MNKLTLFFLVIFTIIACEQKKNLIELKDGLLIKNARIIASEGLSISEESDIVIDQDKIVYIGNSNNSAEVSGIYETIDAQGKYVIPGLIDSHVHVTSTDALSEGGETENSELVKSYLAQLPKSYLYFGYTTLIDLGTSRPKRLSEFNNADLKPDLFYVGGGAVIGNGYGLSNWGDSIPNFIYQEDENYPIPEKYLKVNHTPEAVARRVSESGGIAIKTYYEPGFDPTQPPLPTPSKELMESIKTEAHKNGLVLVAHGNSHEAHHFLANAQVDVIAHGLWNWGDERLGEDNLIPSKISTILDLEVQNKIKYMPTLQVINGLKSLATPNFLNDPELKNVLPKNIITYYQENSESMYTEIFGDAPKENINRSFTRISKQGKFALNYLYQKKGKILFATDTPAAPTFGNPPGYNGYLEMIEMANAGIPLGVIYKSATIENARAFNLDSLYGTIEVGKKSNILILNQNPLEDISAYNDISKVIIQGRAWDRGRLSATRN
jgi:imidazolonepropionase-like amidohydrolase